MSLKGRRWRWLFAIDTVLANAEVVFVAEYCARNVIVEGAHGPAPGRWSGRSSGTVTYIHQSQRVSSGSAFQNVPFALPSISSKLRLFLLQFQILLKNQSQHCAKDHDNNESDNSGEKRSHL